MRRMAYTVGSLVMLIGVIASVRAGAITANGPYYAWPAWAQKLPAATRFVIMTNWNSEAVLDRETGLVWERSPDPLPRDWSEARSHCIVRIVGDRLGWRLPTIEELTSLMDRSQPPSSLPAGHPFTTPVPPFRAWTLTPTFLLQNGAFLGSFDGTPFPVLQGAIQTTSTAWCVRGGQGSDGKFF